MSGYRIQSGGSAAQEISFPSYIAADVTYQPLVDLEQAGVSLINGIVVLNTVVREVAGNV